MCLEEKDYMVWWERTESLTTKELHNLDLYWRDNADNSIDDQLHGIVETILVQRK